MTVKVTSEVSERVHDGGVSVAQGQAGGQLAGLKAYLRRLLGLLSEEEFAAVGGVTLNTLAVWRAEGRGPAYTKIGRTVFYKVEDVKKYLDDNTVEPKVT